MIDSPGKLCYEGICLDMEELKAVEDSVISGNCLGWDFDARLRVEIISLLKMRPRRRFLTSLG